VGPDRKQNIDWIDTDNRSTEKTSITVDGWSAQEEKTFGDGLIVICSKNF